MNSVIAAEQESIKSANRKPTLKSIEKMVDILFLALGITTHTPTIISSAITSSTISHEEVKDESKSINQSEKPHDNLFLNVSKFEKLIIKDVIEYLLKFEQIRNHHTIHNTTYTYPDPTDNITSLTKFLYNDIRIDKASTLYIESVGQTPPGMFCTTTFSTN